MHFSDVICCPTILLCVFLPQRFEERIQLDSYLDFDEWRLPTNHQIHLVFYPPMSEGDHWALTEPSSSHLSSQENLAYLLYTGDFATQLYWIDDKPLQIILRIPMNQLGYRNVIRVFEHCSLRHGKFEGLVFCPSEHAHTLRCFIRSHPNGTVDKPWNPCVFPWNGCFCTLATKVFLPWKSGHPEKPLN